jgi:hypothetical protein
MPWKIIDVRRRAEVFTQSVRRVLRYLRGPMRGRILDLTYSDAFDLYRQPKPTWVAAALMEWQPE